MHATERNAGISRRRWIGALPWLAGAGAIAQPVAQVPGTRPPDSLLPRVLVSTDVGGTDPDDFQSLVHLLVYADALQLEGLVSSPYGPGRREHILEVVAEYETDFPNLRTWSPAYPSSGMLRTIAKQGATQGPGARGFGVPTEGSTWIAQCARRPDPRPLWVLVWGGIEDLAQALHDAPDILPKLRVYFIGGPNKMWSVDAYNYIETHHPELWMIESNATYRGWFTGGYQGGDLGNTSFVQAHIAGRGALGKYFAAHLRGVIKMGDTPSVAYLLRGTPEDPTQPGWGGQYVRLWDDRKKVFRGLTTAAHLAEVFGVVEFELPFPNNEPGAETTQMLFDGRIPAKAERDGGVLRFRFSPRDAKVWPYLVQSTSPLLNGKQGAFTAAPPPPERTRLASTRHPHWWIDDPDPAYAEGIHPGAKTVNRWRAEFLRDFAARMERCHHPQP